MRIIGEIPIIDGTEEESVRRQVASGEPAVIRELVSRWPAYRRWTRDFLADRFGDVEVSYRRSPSNVHPPLDPGDGASRPGSRRARLADYLDLMSVTPTVFLDANLVRLYTRRGAANQALAPLLGDVRVPAIVDLADLDTVGLWISGREVRTRLHYDRNGRHNLNAQLAGRKHVVLVPPSEVRGLYPYAMSSPVYNFSRVDDAAPDLDAFPDYADVVGWHATLEAGDLLYLPAFWYHAFTHAGEFNLNVNFWYDATDVRLSAVALRNEIATMLGAVGAGGRSPFTDALDRQALAWSPRRATLDERDADGHPVAAGPPFSAWVSGEEAGDR